MSLLKTSRGREEAQDIAGKFREYMHLERKQGSDGLSVSELQRWTELKDLLNHHFHPGLTKEKARQRNSVRLPTRLNVSFGSAGEMSSSLLTNVSRGGIFVSTESLLPIGSRLQLRLRVEDPLYEVDTQGEVVSHDVAAGAAAQPGMGIRFVNLSEDQQKAVDELYHRAAQRLIHDRSR